MITGGNTDTFMYPPTNVHTSMNHTAKPCKTAANHAGTVESLSALQCLNTAADTSTMNHPTVVPTNAEPDRDTNTVKMQRNYRIERSSDAGPNYKLISMKGNVVARFNWLNVGGIRVAMGDGSIELSPSTVELVNHGGNTPASDTETSYAAGARVTEADE